MRQLIEILSPVLGTKASIAAHRPPRSKLGGTTALDERLHLSTSTATDVLVGFKSQVAILRSDNVKDREGGVNTGLSHLLSSGTCDDAHQ